MRVYDVVDSVDVSTRRARKYAVILAIEILEKVRFREEERLADMAPARSRSRAYARTDESIDNLINAIIVLQRVRDT